MVYAVPWRRRTLAVRVTCVPAKGLPVSAPAAGMPRISRPDLDRAVSIYLERAYGAGPVPSAVRARVDWSPERSAQELFENQPFERAHSDESEGLILALRLGNLRYPHMKLQVQGWPNDDGYLLSVNTHDQVLTLEPGSFEYDACRELQEYNKVLKEGIEHAWDDAGLATFLRYLRDYLESRGEPPDPFPSA